MRIAFLFPQNGDHVNERDGALRDGTLFIDVTLSAPHGATVTVNGISAKEAAGVFSASVPVGASRTKLTAVDHTNGTTATVSVFYVPKTTKRYRISSDDNILFLADLNSHPEYTSLFDNPYLAVYRKAHELYGAKVQLNLFYEFNRESARHFSSPREDFNLSMMTDRYKAEWEENSDWLRLSFHARHELPDYPYQNATAEEITKDYLDVRREVIRFAGEKTFSDEVTTIHWGATTPECVAALKKLGHKALMGYFEIGKNGNTIVSYDAPVELVRHIGQRDFYTDTARGITFGKIDLVTNLGTLSQCKEKMAKIIADPHCGGFVSFMIHEQFFYKDFVAYLPDFEERVLEPARLLYESGYRSSFIREVLP